MAKTLQLLLGVCISAAMMYVAFRDVDLVQLGETISTLTWWPVLAFVGLCLVHFVVRSIRWRYLLPEGKDANPSLRELFDSIVLGNLASFLLPFRLGEFIRPLILSRWTEHSFATAFASVVIERFFDLAAALITFAIIIPMLPELPESARYGAVALGTVAVGLLVFIVLGCLIPETLRAIVAWCARFLPAKLGAFGVKFTSDLLAGASVVRTLPRLALIISLTVVVWISSYAQFYVLFWMFPHPHTILLAVTSAVFVALAVALPSTPGFVGVFQLACVAAAALLNYPHSAAQAYSLIIHVLTYVVLIVIGFYLLAVHDLSLGELRLAVQKKPKEETA